MIGVAVLGATGSIGRSTLEVLALHRDKYRVTALAAQRSSEEMAHLCLQWRPSTAVMTDEAAAIDLQRRLAAAGCTTRVLAGTDALEAVACDAETTVVMAAISGAAGLRSTLAAAAAGKRLLLANKESAVMAGPLLIEALQRSGGTLVPIDSEHNAIFQCLPHDGRVGRPCASVRRLLLTASGGPFLHWTAAQMTRATPEQACRHPRWNMGRKISVDSATLMNKGLELIEASVLFGMPTSRIEVLVHPQSVVHSLVEYVDGSTLAQLGSPDMRTPIAHALAWPGRIAAGVEFLDLVRVGRLDFEAPDLQRFPALRMAADAAESGGLAPAWLNAADEVAVAAFLDKRLNFGDIPAVIASTMEGFGGGKLTDLGSVLAADQEARRHANEAVRRLAAAPQRTTA